MLFVVVLSVVTLLSEVELLLFVLVSMGFGIFYMFGKQLNGVVPIIIGIIAMFIIWYILSNKGSKNSFLKKRKLFYFILSFGQAW